MANLERYHLTKEPRERLTADNQKPMTQIIAQLSYRSTVYSTAFNPEIRNLETQTFVAILPHFREPKKKHFSDHVYLPADIAHS